LELYLISNFSDNYIHYCNYPTLIFSYIKILQNSKELHLVDSTWASMCYLLDAKYKMFKNKKIFLYPYERSGGLLKDKNQTNLNPINLRNWIIVN
jgi:hypothetical protein